MRSVYPLQLLETLCKPNGSSIVTDHKYANVSSHQDLLVIQKLMNRAVKIWVIWCPGSWMMLNKVALYWFSLSMLHNGLVGQRQCHIFHIFVILHWRFHCCRWPLTVVLKCCIVSNCRKAIWCLVTETHVSAALCPGMSNGIVDSMSVNQQHIFYEVSSNNSTPKTGLCMDGLMEMWLEVHGNLVVRGP